MNASTRGSLILAFWAVAVSWFLACGGVADPSAWIREMPLEAPVSPTVPGRLVCDAIEHERFLVLTHPEPIRERIAERGADPDAFVTAQIERLPTPPNLPPR